MEILRRSLNLFNPRLVEIDMIAKVGNWTKEALCECTLVFLPVCLRPANYAERRTLRPD